MLDRDEISSRLPCITDRSYGSSIKQRRNLVKRTLVNNQAINLFLPINQKCTKDKFSPLLKKINELKTINHLDKHHHRDLDSHRQNNHQSRNSMNINSNYLKCFDNPIDLNTIQTKVKLARNQLKTFENESNTELNIGQCFNIKSLTNKVKLITNSLKGRKRNSKELSNRSKAIKNKKDSKSVKEYLKNKQSIDIVKHQAMILDEEYDTLINEIMHSPRVQIESPHSRNILLKPSNTDLTSDTHFTQRPANIHLNRVPSLKYKVNKSLSQISRSQSKIKERIQLAEIGKRYSDRFDDFQLYFNDKYHKSLLKILKEQKLHLNHKIFPENAIDSIMKSKKGVVIDTLMSKYISNYNKHIDLKTKLQSKIKTTMSHLRNKTEVMFSLKENRRNKINSKLNQALIDSEKGAIVKRNYQFKDYINDINIDII